MPASLDPAIFTTGRIAKICHVATRTVCKWIDSGKLPGYRLPGSSDRRVQRQTLIAFLRENRMPIGELGND